MVEHLTVNQRVAGSSPAPGASKKQSGKSLVVFYFLRSSGREPCLLRQQKRSVRESCSQKCRATSRTRRNVPPGSPAPGAMNRQVEFLWYSYLMEPEFGHDNEVQRNNPSSIRKLGQCGLSIAGSYVGLKVTEGILNYGLPFVVEMGVCTAAGFANVSIRRATTGHQSNSSEG